MTFIIINFFLSNLQKILNSTHVSFSSTSTFWQWYLFRNKKQRESTAENNYDPGTGWGVTVSKSDTESYY